MLPAFGPIQMAKGKGYFAQAGLDVAAKHDDLQVRAKLQDQTDRLAVYRSAYEWTYTPETATLANKPSGWCLKGGASCARFFGGQTSSSKYAVMWQWSGGGGVRNGFGDFDQINAARLK